MHLQDLERQEQLQTKINSRKEITNMRIKINALENSKKKVYIYQEVIYRLQITAIRTSIHFAWNWKKKYIKPKTQLVAPKPKKNQSGLQQ